MFTRIWVNLFVFAWFLVGCFLSSPSVGAQAVSLKIPADRDHTLSAAVYDDQGRKVRTLLSGQAVTGNLVSVRWDGLDDDGQPVKPGTYKWKSIAADVRAEYCLVALNSGQPPYWTRDGKGGWGGIHGNVLAVSHDTTGVYLAWQFEEGQAGILKVQPDGKVIWRQHSIGQVNGIYTDGQTLYVLGGEVTKFWNAGGEGWNNRHEHHALIQPIVFKLRADTGELIPYGDRELINGQVRYRVNVGKAFDYPMRFSQDNPFTTHMQYANALGYVMRGKRDTLPMLIGINAGDILAACGRVYVSLPLEDRIVVLDGESTNQVSTIDLPAPRGLSIAPEGGLAVVSRNKVLHLAEDGKVLGALISSGLEAPHDVTADSKGNLYVTDLGYSQQLKIFSPQGKLLRTIGKKGGRPFGGKMQPNDLLFPSSVTVLDDGTIYLGEDSPPRRVLAFTPEGKLKYEWIGPMLMSSGGLNPIVDPDNPEQVYVAGPNAELYRLKVDYQKHTWKVDAYWWGVYGNVRRQEPVPGQQPMSHYQAAVVKFQGKKYIFHGDCMMTLWRIDGYKLIPSASIGTRSWEFPCSVYDRWWDEVASKRSPPPVQLGKRVPLIWHDVNSNGKMDLDEIIFYYHLDDKFISGPTKGIDDNLNLYFACAALAMGDKILGTENRIYKLPRVGMDGAGNPVYDFNKLEVVVPDSRFLSVDRSRIDPKATGAPVLFGPDTIWRDATGNIYGAGNADGTAKGVIWATRTLDCRIGKWGPDGKLIWKDGSKTTAFAKPGEFYRTSGVGPGIRDVVPFCDWNAQVRLWTEDGLYVGNIPMGDDYRQGAWTPWGKYLPGQDTYQGQVAETDVLHGELNNCTLFTHPKTGKDYAWIGDLAGAHLFEIKGLSDIRRSESTVTITAADIADIRDSRSTESVADTERKTIEILRAVAQVSIDGDLNDWPKSLQPALIAVDPAEKELRGSVLAQWDKDYLYLAYRVVDSSPMMNAGDIPEKAFKTGDTVEVFLAVDEKADPNRTKPVIGDYRVLMTKLRNATPVVFGMEYVSEKVNNPITYGAAGPEVTVDRSGIIEGAKLAVQQAAVEGMPGYVAEVRIPWAYFGYTPRIGAKLLFNVAINFSDPSGRYNVLKPYWNGPSHITTDVGTEARMHPNWWGWAVLK